MTVVFFFPMMTETLEEHDKSRISGVLLIFLE